MLSVGNLLLFAGYVLVYAAVANRGVMATDPWLGLFTDAYTNSGAGAPIPGYQNQPGVQATAPPAQRRRQDKRAGPLAKSYIPTPPAY